tara:strand:- start:67 stop:177 length:111 start_codon:yes stop_codon:yes gene_type:complete
MLNNFNFQETPNGHPQQHFQQNFSVFARRERASRTG